MIITAFFPYTQARAKKGLLQLSRDTPVVKFNMSTKLMEVTYDGRLVTAEMEARSLAALALPPPPQAAALDTLAATLAQARALHQVIYTHTIYTGQVQSVQLTQIFIYNISRTSRTPLRGRG